MRYVRLVFLVLAVSAVPVHGDSKPDLSGVWDFRTLTPLERPKDLGDKAVLTPEEAAELAARASARVEKDAQPVDADREPPPPGNVGSYNVAWFDSGAQVVEDLRTSLLVDPENGRLPELVEGVERQALGGERPEHGVVRVRVGGMGVDGPEDRGLSERCLQGFNAGPPILPGGYNQNLRILVTPEDVVLVTEMNHDARVVRMGEEHGPEDLRAWKGDSIGRFEGDTLVVETKNFTPKIASFAPSAFLSVGNAQHLKLTERFSLDDQDTLRYEFTVDDPSTFTRPFSGVLLMKRADFHMYEYACHEGNYAMKHMLSAARYEEQQAGEQSEGSIDR